MCPTEPITDGELKRADPKLWLLSGMQLTMALTQGCALSYFVRLPPIAKISGGHATGISTARYPNTLLGGSGDLVSGRIMGITGVATWLIRFISILATCLWDP